MSDLIGKTLGQYQMIELIQDMGTALVYKGFQPNMNRFVMVKVLKSQDPLAVRAFTQQNELLAQIQHPNILPVYDSGQAEGQVYRALRYAEGGVLQNHLMQYYNLEIAVGLMSGIVAGLEKIHAQGFIHGNLQPGNIYLDEAGQPLLTDFGLPKTSADPITPFISPEQMQGGIVDKRTDVYALGVLLYVLATGAIPPAGVVVSLRSKRPDLPESVEKVIFKAMAQNPDARFQSVREFQNALLAAVQPVVPVQAMSQAQAYQPAAYRRGTNWAAIILGIILVMILVGGAGLILGWWGNQASVPSAGIPVEPPVEAPPPTQLPEIPEVPIEQPTEAPIIPPEGSQPEGGTQLPPVCNSLGVAGGLVVLGSMPIIRKRSLSKRRDHNL